MACWSVFLATRTSFPRIWTPRRAKPPVNMEKASALTPWAGDHLIRRRPREERMPKAPPKSARSLPAALARLRDPKIRKVKVAVSDIDGVLRGKYMHKDKFLSAVESGFGFCNVVFGWDAGDQCYDNGRYTGWHTGFPDAQANIDLNTFRQIPWDDDTPMFLGDFVDAKGAPLAVCP